LPADCPQIKGWKLQNNLTSVIALDVGGSSVKSGLVQSDGSVHFVSHTPIISQASKAEVLQEFVKIIQMYLHKVDSNELLGIAFGFPGPFDYENGLCLIQGQSKYDNLYQVNIRDELKRILDFDKSILFCNDAEAAIIGEANYGTGQDFGRVIGITLGTGLGTAFIVNGVSVHAGQGIPPNAELFPLKFNAKRADDLFSTRGLIERFQSRGFYYSNVAEATKDIKHGNTSLIQIFHEFGEDLGQFLRPFVDDFAADVLIVLGGIAGAMEYFRNKLENQLNIPVFSGAIQGAALLGAATLLLY
jgi:glucokinase